ncbi:unnamed protein product [Orchesella dallaii]|uniref:Uncharacterized protein n=1 Tax=Orchesella dallaii TaxID=48710 RepID=A0ABP1S3G7_9HEXA
MVHQTTSIFVLITLYLTLQATHGSAFTIPSEYKRGYYYSSEESEEARTALWNPFNMNLNKPTKPSTMSFSAYFSTSTSKPISFEDENGADTDSTFYAGVKKPSTKLPTKGISAYSSTSTPKLMVFEDELENETDAEYMTDIGGQKLSKDKKDTEIFFGERFLAKAVLFRCPIDQVYSKFQRRCIRKFLLRYPAAIG